MIQSEPTRIRIGISACLLGEKVRYNGGHKLDRFLRDTLGGFVEYVPVCPEVEAGLPTPREAMRLVGDPGNPRVLTSNTGEDMTGRMRGFSERRVKELESEDLCGFIFMRGSPSSGMERVKVYNDKGMPVKRGVGVFARAFMDRFPLLPVEENGRLCDPKLREHFIERIFTLARWREMDRGRRTRGKLVDFHTRHKLLIRSHDPTGVPRAGRAGGTGRGIPSDGALRPLLRGAASGSREEGHREEACRRAPARHGVLQEGSFRG